MARAAWSLEEVEATVADYLAMLVEYHTGERLNKKAHNRALQRLLCDRSPAAIEFKHQNISAVLVGEGLDYLDGYLPAYNFQDLLRGVVLEQVAARPAIRALIEQVVGESVTPRPELAKEPLEEVPVPRTARVVARERYVGTVRPRIVDFDLIEARNRSLGLAGEQAVMAFEHRRLWAAGKKSLAERLEHVSRSQGDGLGYDIGSFELDGRERLIEVKTTRRAQLTPFYLTRNEVDVSKTRADVYHLYRLFRFERDPRFFILSGALPENCRLEPTAYRADVA
jgi:hypothetical protein